MLSEEVAVGEVSRSSLGEEVEVAEAEGTWLVTVTVCLMTLPELSL